MSLATDLHAFLVGQAGISGVISTRLYPRRAPKTPAGDYAVYNRIDGRSLHDLGGAIGLTLFVYQYDFYADEPADVEAVAEAFRNELDGLTGAVGSSDVRRINLIDERDDLTDLDNGDEEGKERITHDYEIVFHRAVPTL